jgi:hypothetical protein
MSLCPCQSGRPFAECHGNLPAIHDEELRAAMAGPLFIHETKLADGRAYKIVGTVEQAVRAEAMRTAPWLAKTSR